MQSSNGHYNLVLEASLGGTTTTCSQQAFGGRIMRNGIYRHIRVLNVSRHKGNRPGFIYARLKLLCIFIFTIT
jgi:hypothetical protein